MLFFVEVFAAYDLLRRGEKVTLSLMANCQVRCSWLMAEYARVWSLQDSGQLGAVFSASVSCFSQKRKWPEQTGKS